MKTLQELKKQKAKRNNLIQLADCSIVKILEDTIDQRGCETCDYGSRYGVNYTFKFSDGGKFRTEIANSYEARISQGDMMFFLLNNLDKLALMTKKDFKNLFKNPDLILGKGY